MDKKIRFRPEQLTKSSDQNKAVHSVIFLVGPTAVGKTNLSFYLSEKLSAPILNCDSIQMYKGLDIGSAKPILKKSEKKNSIFLFDEWDPPFICTAGVFRKKALSVLKQELSHRSVLAVGGSGFYIQALEKGMYPIKTVKSEIKEKVKEIHREKGLAHLYKLLQFLDPEYAKQVSCRDIYRIFRGICIILSEEKPLSFIRSSFQVRKLPWPYLKVGLYLPREALLKNVQDRTDEMIEKGLLEEVQCLLNKGLKDWPLMKSVGYREAVLCLRNQLSRKELKTHIIHRTMQLAKKQISWFKRDKNIQWYLSKNENWPKIHKDIANRIFTYGRFRGKSGL